MQRFLVFIAVLIGINVVLALIGALLEFLKFQARRISVRACEG